MTDSLRPTRNWGSEAEQFRALTGQQLLCAVCVLAGDLTPPAQIIVYAGQSYCLNDFKTAMERFT